jgi:hypothetical protein
MRMKPNICRPIWPAPLPLANGLLTLRGAPLPPARRSAHAPNGNLPKGLYHECIPFRWVLSISREEEGVGCRVSGVRCRRSGTGADLLFADLRPLTSDVLLKLLDASRLTARIPNWRSAPRTPHPAPCPLWLPKLSLSLARFERAKRTSWCVSTGLHGNLRPGRISTGRSGWPPTAAPRRRSASNS